MGKILITGSEGGVGRELTSVLRARYGKHNVIGVDIKKSTVEGPFYKVDILDKKKLESIIRKNKIDIIFHLIGVLLPQGENNPHQTWDSNLVGLKHMLDLAVKHKVLCMFWPSSIAVFGPESPQKNTPQNAHRNPHTIFGVSKASGELLCHYYHARWNLDIRSLRYPGIISFKSEPTDEMTDYAMAMVHSALNEKNYSCCLKKNSKLPMMYIKDVVRAIVELMEAPLKDITIRTSYNLDSPSFSPKELAKVLKRYCPNFEVNYEVCPKRQLIADSWPKSIDGSKAAKDWGWMPKYNLPQISADLLRSLDVQTKL